MANILRENRSIVLIGLSVILLGAASAIGYQKIMEGPPPKESRFFDTKFYTGYEMPMFDVEDFSNKRSLYRELKNGKTLLIYMTTGCQACKIEAGFLGRADELEKKDIDVFIVGHETFEVFEKFKETYGVDLPIFYDRSNEFRRKLKIESTPTHIYVRDGIILGSWSGTYEGAGIKYMLKKIESIESNYTRGRNEINN